jgi:hypothetical protein
MNYFLTKVCIDCRTNVNMETTVAFYTNSSKPVERAHMRVREGILKDVRDHKNKFLI